MNPHPVRYKYVFWVRKVRYTEPRHNLPQITNLVGDGVLT